MQSSKLIEAVCAYAQEAAGLPFTLYADAIPTDAGDAGCVRCAPAAASERRYIDDSKLVRWQLSVYVRCIAQDEARQYALAVCDVLDGKELTLDDGVVVRCEAISLPQWLEADQKGATYYLAAFSTEYLQDSGVTA